MAPTNLPKLLVPECDSSDDDCGHDLAALGARQGVNSTHQAAGAFGNSNRSLPRKPDGIQPAPRSEHDKVQTPSPSGSPAASYDGEISPPPTDRTFQTADEAITFLRGFTSMHGYAVTTKRSKKDNKSGETIVIYLQCDRGGKYKSTVPDENRKRMRTTRRQDCPFDAVLRYSKVTSTWSLNVRNPNHNHPPSPSSAHPALRRQELLERSEQIAAQIFAGDSTPTIILGLQKQGSTALKAQDIVNLRKALRRSVDGIC